MGNADSYAVILSDWYIAGKLSKDETFANFASNITVKCFRFILITITLQNLFSGLS